MTTSSESRHVSAARFAQTGEGVHVAGQYRGGEEDRVTLPEDGVPASSLAAEAKGLEGGGEWHGVVLSAF